MSAFFIQARTSSTRLPKKMLMPIWRDKTMLQLIIERINAKFPDKKAYLLTTTNKSDDELVKSIVNYPIKIFRGDEQDVLGRFVRAAEHFGETDIIRVCADNPFLLTEYVDTLLKDDSKSDYISFRFNGIPTIKCHFGFFTERVKVDALKKANQLTDNPIYHEHVTNFIYENPDIFNLKFIDTSDLLAKSDNLRMTIDTKEDFNNAAYILNKISDPINPSFSELIYVLEKNPSIIKSMSLQIDRNKK